jgi:hypothetical protein
MNIRCPSTKDIVPLKVDSFKCFWGRSSACDIRTPGTDHILVSKKAGLNLLAPQGDLGSLPLMSKLRSVPFVRTSHKKDRPQKLHFFPGQHKLHFSCNFCFHFLNYGFLILALKDMSKSALDPEILFQGGSGHLAFCQLL